MVVFMLGIAFTRTVVGQDRPKQLVEVARLKMERTRFGDLLLTEQGDLLIVQPVIGKTEAWDLKKKVRLWSLETDSASLRLSDNEEEMLWVDTSKRPAEIVHSDVRTGKDRNRRALGELRGRMGSGEFSCGPKPIIAAIETFDDGANIVVFSFETGKILNVFDEPTTKPGKEPELYGVAVTPDGKRFLIATGGSIAMCDEMGKLLNRWETEAAPSRIRILPDGKSAIAAGIIFGSPIYSIDLVAGKMTERKEHRYGASSLDISRDGKWCVSGGQCRFAADKNYDLREDKQEGGAVILWNTAKMEPAVKIHPAVDCIEGVALSADGRWLAAAETGDAEGQIMIYQVSDK